jgi:clan AA aspartic protease (TIGR02281 family)
MTDSKFGKAVFIAAAITLTKPSLAQSLATSSQAAMTFAVEKKAVRLSATANGVLVRFLVDTGTTMVAFPREAAGKLGVNLESSSATSTASTADGTKYPIMLFWLKRLQIGSCVLRNVEAMIVAGPMPEPLLGMSALLRMNVEMSDGKMSLSCPVDPAPPAVAPGSGAKPREPSRRPLESHSRSSGNSRPFRSFGADDWARVR